MIRYDPLWKTMKEKKISQYDLYTHHDISRATLHRFRKNKFVDLYTIDKLCGILDCTIPDIVEYYKKDDEK